MNYSNLMHFFLLNLDLGTDIGSNADLAQKTPKNTADTHVEYLEFNSTDSARGFGLDLSAQAAIQSIIEDTQPSNDMYDDFLNGMPFFRGNFSRENSREIWRNKYFLELLLLLLVTLLVLL